MVQVKLMFGQVSLGLRTTCPRAGNLKSLMSSPDKSDMYVVFSSHTAAFIGKRKITNFWVNSFTQKSGSQEDNQASICGCSRIFCCRQGCEDA